MEHLKLWPLTSFGLQRPHIYICVYIYVYVGVCMYIGVYIYVCVWLQPQNFKLPFKCP